MTVGATVVACVAVGSQGGFSADRPRLLSGAAWLVSTRVGQLALLDGSSAEVAAQVLVANRDDRLDAVQHGADGYAVNRTTGTIRRVKGSTFAVTPPAAPLPDARGGLQAIVGPGVLYTLDNDHGVLAAADPSTLTPRNGLVPVAARLDPQAAVLDDAGRLWALDPATGDLVWVDQGARRSRRGVATPNAGRLVISNHVPVVVDLARRVATVVDTVRGGARGSVDLGLSGDEHVQVAGSSNSYRLYLATSRGVLHVCDLAESTCDDAVSLARATGHELGAPVESGDRLFVPDYTSGKVWIVDLARGRVTADPSILDPNTRFQLLSRDGVVFFNDPASEHAGVIRLDGGVEQVLKYNPDNPDKGVTSGSSRPGGGPSDASSPNGQPSKGLPWDGQPAAGSPPARTPATASPGAARRPAGESSTRPNDGTTDNTQRPGTVQISVSRSPAQVDEDVTLAVVATGGGRLAQARWNFGDGASAEGLTTTHRWGAAQTYQISVVAAFDDGQSATTSIAVQVVQGRARLTVTVSGAGGTVSGDGISCPSTCDTMVGLGQSVTLAATAADGFTFAGWSGACTGGDTSCTVLISGDRTVAASFEASAPRLAAPVLTSPAEGAVLWRNPPQFTVAWQPVTGAARYRVEFECDCGEGPWVHEPTQTETSRGWIDDTSGRWRVTALAPDGTLGTPSGWRTFRYDTWAGFTGTWINVDPNTEGIVRLSVTRPGSGAATVQVWAACHPTACDWGTATVTQVGDELRADFDKGFAVHRLRIRRSGTRLEVVDHCQFAPTDGRPDYTATDYLGPA